MKFSIIRMSAVSAVALFTTVSMLNGCATESGDEHGESTAEALNASCAQILCAPNYKCVEGSGGATCVKNLSLTSAKPIVRTQLEQSGTGGARLARLRGLDADGVAVAVAELREDATGYAELSLSVFADGRWKTRVTKDANNQAQLRVTGAAFDEDFERRERELSLAAKPDGGGTAKGAVACALAIAGAVLACGGTAPLVAPCALASATAICACNAACGG